MEEQIDPREQPLIDAMVADPDDELAKVRYEQFLAENRPEAVEREFLRLQRQLAELHTDEAAFDRLVDEYEEFLVRTFDWFWDRRGQTNFLCRRLIFKVWLVSFHESRRFAVELAVKFRVKAPIDLDRLPAVLFSLSPQMARSEKQAFIEFVRRYRGPSGNEPEVKPEEIVLRITPSWMDRPA